MPSATAAQTLARMRASIGVRGALEAVLYPLLTPPFVLAAWVRSLWLARVLLDGQWHRYRGFHPGNALTAFFYATQWLNISRFGVRGRSPLVGLGDYPLSRWFHLTLLSSCLYAQAGAVCTLGGTLAWVFLHLAWLDAASSWWWVIALTATLLLSSTAYAMAFTRQNYNILGWMWLPLALFAVTAGHGVLAALSFLAASLGSITAVFAVIPLMIVLAVQTGTIAPLLVLVPAVLKLALHLQPMLASAGARSAIASMAKMIGASSSGVRYVRESMRLRPFSAYFIVVYAAGIALLWVDRGIPVLPLAALGLFLVNQTLVRFADEQSVILLFVSVVAAQLMGQPPSLPGWVALAVVANPMPVFLGLCAYERDHSLVRVRPRAPFDHSALLAACERFLGPVPAGATALFAFDDPQGVYENLFDGYRTVLEVPRYVAAKQGVHLVPDWHAIAETNHPGSPSWWGRSPDAVRANVERLGASHVVVYGDSGTSLDAAWARLGFVEESSFDWGDWSASLDGEVLWRSPRPPCWWLLAAPPRGGAAEIAT